MTHSHNLFLNKGIMAMIISFEDNGNVELCPVGTYLRLRMLVLTHCW